MEAVEKKEEPFIGGPHILSNMSLLKEIYDRCNLTFPLSPGGEG
jgi:hypothetical protein